MATPDQIIDLWRYNINLSARYNPSSKYSGTSKTTWKHQYKVRLYHKESSIAVIGLMDVSAAKYLREIASALAIKHLTATPPTQSYTNLEERLFYAPIQFHMQQGLSVADMLFNGTSAAELTSLSMTMERGLATHPETKDTLAGVREAAKMVEKENTDMIWELMNRYVHKQKCLKLYAGTWEKVHTDNNGVAQSGKVDIFYYENAARPFSIRVSNCATEQVYPSPVYPEKQEMMQSYLISLSSEEFIGRFLIPMCEDSEKHKEN